MDSQELNNPSIFICRISLSINRIILSVHMRQNFELWWVLENLVSWNIVSRFQESIVVTGYPALFDSENRFLEPGLPGSRNRVWLPKFSDYPSFYSVPRKVPVQIFSSWNWFSEMVLESGTRFLELGTCRVKYLSILSNLRTSSLKNRIRFLALLNIFFSVVYFLYFVLKNRAKWLVFFCEV